MKQANVTSDLPMVSDFFDDALAIGGATVDHRLRRMGSLKVSEQGLSARLSLRCAKTARASASQFARSAKRRSLKDLRGESTMSERRSSV
jgi:hypothetical protein